MSFWFRQKQPEKELEIFGLMASGAQNFREISMKLMWNDLATSPPRLLQIFHFSLKGSLAGNLLISLQVRQSFLKLPGSETPQWFMLAA